MTAELTGRPVFEGDLRVLVERFPALMTELGVAVDGPGRVTYPDAAGINARLAKARLLGGLTGEPPFKFAEYKGADGRGGEVPAREYIEFLARGEFPISAAGSQHFHDFAIHVAGILAMPDATAAFIKQNAKRLLALAGDKALNASSPRWKGIIEKSMDRFIKSVDVGTGVLLDDAGDAYLTGQSLRALNLEDLPEIMGELAKGLDLGEFKKHDLPDPKFDINAQAAEVVSRAGRWAIPAPESAVKLGAGGVGGRIAQTIKAMRDALGGKPSGKKVLDTPVSDSEVDAMFKQNPQWETTGIDVSGLDPARASVSELTRAVEAAGGKVRIGESTVIEVSLPEPKLAELALRLQGTGAKLMTSAEYAKARGSSGGSRLLIESWDASAGSKLVGDAELVKQRKEAISSGREDALEARAKQAVENNEIADAGWQGPQGCRPTCMLHTVSNASNGKFSFADAMEASKAAGADAANAGVTAPELEKMLGHLEGLAKQRGQTASYRTVPIEDFFRQQREAAAAGKPVKPGFVAIKTGEGAGANVYHAVTLHGAFSLADGRQFIAITDSQFGNRKQAFKLLYSYDAFAKALISNGVLIIDVAAAKAVQ